MATRAGARLPLGVLLGALACRGSAVGPPPSTPRIDYVDGAIEPVLLRGQSVTIEGFGFENTQGAGAVTFPRVGGGVVIGSVPPGGWTDRAIRVAVPDGATGGRLTVTTSTGRALLTTVSVIPQVPFDPATLAWQARPAFPRAPVGVALAAGTEPVGSGLRVTLYAAGGAEPLGASGDSALVPDSAVFVARVLSGGTIGSWVRPHDLPTARAFAAAAFANRYNSRFDGAALYVLGGIDPSGRARATVYRCLVGPDTALGLFTAIEPLPAPVAGAIALVRRGRIYVIGGTDSLGRPQRNVYVGRIGGDGHIDGWYAQPALPGPRAYGGGLVLDKRVAVFGGIADSAPTGGGLDILVPRLAASDTAPVSLTSGFFTGSWAPAGSVLPEGRSQFATLRLGTLVLVVGGMYASASANGPETLAATAVGDSLGGFAGPVGTNTIAGQGGGTLVGSAGVSWQDAEGTYHGIVIGGIDLGTRKRRDGSWGF